MTHTYATLEISRAAYDEIAQKLRDAGYDHVFDGKTIDMHGIGLEPEPAKPLRAEQVIDPETGQRFFRYAERMQAIDAYLRPAQFSPPRGPARSVEPLVLDRDGFLGTAGSD